VALELARIGDSPHSGRYAAAPVYIAVGFTIVYMLRKLNVGTTPGFLGDNYGPFTQRLAAVFQVVGQIVFTGVQIKASMVVLTALFGMDPKIAAILVTAVFAAYTMMGGLWAVVWTDVFQYGLLMGGLLLATGLAYYYVGGFEALSTHLPDSYFDPTSEGLMTLGSYFRLVILAYSTDHAFLQRGLAAKSPDEARFAYLYTGLNYIVFGGCVVFIGMAAAVLLPGLENQDDALPNLIKKVFPSELRGVFLTAILAVTMSTASSSLAAASAMLVQDLYEPIANRRHRRSQDEVVRDSRIATFVAAISALIMAVQFPNVVRDGISRGRVRECSALSTAGARAVLGQSQSKVRCAGNDRDCRCRHALRGALVRQDRRAARRYPLLHHGPSSWLRHHACLDVCPTRA
jgi:SSS family solute:Na+ symporter